MAERHSNARLRADAGAPTSGVIHLRTRLTADFTVISNALAQRRGSAVTIGVAVYILSLPTGSPVTIAALCEHFSEGEILISRALRELEAAGYLERCRERLPSGQIRTRTYFHDVPGGDPDPDPDGPPTPPESPRPKPRAQKAPPVEKPAPSASVTIADADPRAVAVLASLRLVDPRLVLSEPEAARLAPAVAQWLAADLAPSQITARLTDRLPASFLTRPAGILAYRLRETPLAAPPSRPPGGENPAPPVVSPFQTCDGCERAFRSADPGCCLNCRSEDRLRAVG